MNLPWYRLGQPAGRGGTLPELKVYYGEIWTVLSKYFLPTKQLATTIECPKPGGDGCPRKVVEHSFHDIVAVCGNSPQECEPVRLSRQDLIVYELKIEWLLAALASFLRIRGSSLVQFMPQTWELGTYKVQGRAHISVYVFLLTDHDELQAAVISLLAQKEKPFFMLVPSPDICRVQLADTLQKAGVYLVGLDELARLQETDAEADLLGQYICLVHSDSEAENTFRLEKEHWRVRYRGRTYTIKQSVGMQYITHLIQRSYNDEQEIHASDLHYLVHKEPVIQDTVLNKMTKEQLGELGLDVSGIGKGLDLMTPEGKQWAGRQLQELRRLMEDAEEEGNTSEALRLRASREALEDHVKKAFGLSGRLRKDSDPNERMRKAVSKSIANTLEKLGKKDGDELAIYLDDHLETGLFFSFRKDPNIFWKIIEK